MQVHVGGDMPRDYRVRCTGKGGNEDKEHWGGGGGESELGEKNAGTAETRKSLGQVLE